jgi:hypothetical protein
MKRVDKKLKLQNLKTLAERLHTEGRTADSYTIRQVLALFKEAS